MRIVNTKGIFLMNLALEDSDVPEGGPVTESVIRDQARMKAAEVIQPRFIRDVLVSVDESRQVTVAIVV